MDMDMDMMLKGQRWYLREERAPTDRTP